MDGLRENPIKIDDLGVPLFLEIPISIILGAQVNFHNVVHTASFVSINQGEPPSRPSQSSWHGGCRWSWDAIILSAVKHGQSVIFQRQTCKNQYIYIYDNIYNYK